MTRGIVERAGVKGTNDVRIRMKVSVYNLFLNGIKHIISKV